MSIELIILLLTFAVLIYVFNVLNKNKKLENIPGPKGFPLLGSALEITKGGSENFLNVLNGWYKKYGKRYLVYLGLHPYLFISNAEDLEKILSSQVNIEKAKDYELTASWLGTGLLTSSGQKWHTRRKMLTPAFHFKILEEFLVIMNEQSAIFVNAIRKYENKGTFDILPYVTHATLDIICETAMGKKINAQLQSDSEYVNAIYRISQIIHYRSYRPWLHPNFIWKLSKSGKEEAKCLNILHSFTEKVIKERKIERQNLRKSQLGKSANENELGIKRRLAFLDLLLDAQENDPVALPDSGIREETDTFMFEGHDTIAAGVSWAIYLLGLNQNAQSQIQQEIDDIFGDDKRPITWDDLSRMKYLEMCIKESLRIYPSGPFIARMISFDVVLDEKSTIPAGSTAMLSIFHTHRDPKMFPNPEEFIPERFLPENSVGRHAFSYIPFSAGPRNCIGQKFALMEEKVMISNVLRNFTVTSIESREEIIPLAEVVLRPLNGIKIQLKSRK